MDSLRVAERLAASGATVRPGVGEAELSGFAQRCRLSLPASVVALYRRFDGAPLSVPDASLISVWPLFEVAPLPEVVDAYRDHVDFRAAAAALPHAERYLVFADVLLWSALLAFEARAGEESGPVVRLTRHHHQLLAPDFTRFWEQYLEGPRVVSSAEHA